MSRPFQSPRMRTAVVAAAALMLVACSDSGTGETSATDDSTPEDTAAGSGATEGGDLTSTEPIVLSGQGNQLDAYSITDGETAAQRVISSAEDDPEDGLDINAQLCVFESDGQRMLISGEDTGQPDPPAGWGVFTLTGDEVGHLEAARVAKLTPTFQSADSSKPENYGCGVLEDGRILTTDIGDQVRGANGQLIIWFPPFEGFDEGDISYCKLDVTLPASQSILITGPERFLVAAARGGVYEYSGPLPTDDTPAGGCDSTDSTGRPLATGIVRTMLVEPGPDGLATPAGLAYAPDGGFYASSVFSGVINEYEADGTFRRGILQPPPDEVIAEEPYSTGTPLGLVTDSHGNLWYADIGLVIGDGGVGPGDNTGTVRIIRFADGTPTAPVIVESDLAFPDGLGTFTPGTSD